MRWRRDSRLNGLLVLMAMLPAWELVSRAELVNPLFFPAMTKIIRSFFELSITGAIPLQIVLSLKRAAAGYFLAAAVFIPLGIGMGLWRRIYDIFELVIELARPVPPPVIVPVAMLFFGIGDEMKVFVIFFSCAWPILLNTYDGVRGIDPVLLNTARTFGLSRWRTISRVVLPATSPQIMTGMRISLAITLILVVISEMVGSTDGIGYFILDSQRRFKVSQMYAGMLALAILGYALNQLFLVFYNWVMAWHKGLTAQEG
jgi:ABC-type nitrate/sulfonate/bicarbonate transport system permease component